MKDILAVNHQDTLQSNGVPWPIPKIPHNPTTNLDLLIAWDEVGEKRSSSCQFGSTVNHETCRDQVSASSKSQLPSPYKLGHRRSLEFTRATFCSYWNHQQTDSVTLPHAIMCRMHRWHEGGPAGRWAKSRRATLSVEVKRNASRIPRLALHTTA